MLIGYFVLDLNPIVIPGECMVLHSVDIVVVHVLPPVVVQMLTTSIVTMVDVILEFLYVLVKGVLLSPVCILILFTVVLLNLVKEMLKVV